MLKNLEVAFNFSEDDLFANRAGKLSEGQAKRLRRNFNLYIGSGLVLTLIALVLSAFEGSVLNAFSIIALPLLAILAFSPLRTRFGNKVGAIYGVGGALIGALIAINTIPAMALWIILGKLAFVGFIPGLLALALQQTRNRNETRRVQSITGKISLKVADQSLLQIGDKRFTLNGDQLLALRNNREYTLYYALLSNAILSIEPADLDEGLVERLAISDEPEKAKHDELVLGDDGELVLRRAR